ncbi:MAG: winged helix-turn-helix transcriptional regulator [Nanoarchaeota archaeon]
MRLVPISLLLLLLLSIASGQEFDNYNLEISLEPSGLAHQKMENTLTLNRNTEEILFSTREDIQNIKVYDEYNNLDFTLTDQGILINKEIIANKQSNINIEFDSPGLVKQSGKDFIFSLDLSIPFISKQTQIKLNLPEGFVLSDIDSPISPKPTNIDSDGKSINIIWDINTQEESFIVLYKRGYISLSESMLPIYLSSGFILILLTSLVFILVQKKRAKEFISGTLSEDENQIINLIREDKNTTQKNVSQELGFSKSKMSKLIRRLEEKGTIRKKPFFKTNKFDLDKRLK